MKSLILAALIAAPAVAHADDVTQRSGAIGADFEFLPTGSIRTNLGGGNTTTSDADTAYAVGLVFEDPIDNLVSVGFAPRYIFNVNYANSNGDSATELDLRARVAVGGRLAPRLRAYGFADPGWAINFLPDSFKINNTSIHPNGFCIDVGGGLSYRLSGSVRAYFELGYQWAFQTWSYTGTVFGVTGTINGDDKTEYLQLGFGLSAAID